MTLNKSPYHQEARDEEERAEEKLQNVDIIKCCFSYFFILLRLHVMVAESCKIHPSEFTAK